MGDMRLLVIAAVLLPSLYSCTVMELREGVKRDELRVEVKEGELRSEEDRQSELQQEAKRLQEDLSSQQLSLDDLKSRLRQLQEMNAATVAQTEEQRTRKRRIEKKLQVHHKEVVQIEQGGDSIAEKQKKLEHLKGELRKSLSILVHS